MLTERMANDFVKESKTGHEPQTGKYKENYIQHTIFRFLGGKVYKEQNVKRSWGGGKHNQRDTGELTGARKQWNDILN